MPTGRFIVRTLSFFRGTARRLFFCGGILALCAAPLFVTGCDETPGAVSSTQIPPEVADFAHAPTRVVVDSLPNDRVQNNTVQVPLAVQARATDADGTVQRVEFTIEPSQNPRNTLVLDLPPAQGDRYAGAVSVGLPVVDEIYTVRVYAIDNDSLVSNQVRGQFRVVAPTDTTSATASVR